MTRFTAQQIEKINAAFEPAPRKPQIRMGHPSAKKIAEMEHARTRPATASLKPIRKSTGIIAIIRNLFGV